MHGFWSDLRQAGRAIRTAPTFSAIASLSLTLAIGAATAVFTMLDAVVLRPLPVREPEQLVAVETVRPDGVTGDLSLAAFERLGHQQRVFQSVIGYWGDGIFNVAAGAVLTRADVWAVTGNFYADLGIHPFAGRLLTERDVDMPRRAAANVAVVGYGFWQRQLGGDSGVIGRPLRVERAAFTIVGIAPKGFTAFGIATEPDVTIPLTAAFQIVSGTPLDRLLTRSRWVGTMGRLKPGVTLDDARAQLTAMWPAIRAATLPGHLQDKEREEEEATRLQVGPGAHGRDWFLRSHFSKPLVVLLGVACLMLLIACVNLACLMVSRTAARSHELSVRLALGAARRRIARQMMVEGLALSALAIPAGIVFAAWSSSLLAAFITRDYLVPSVLNVAPHARVFAFAAVAAMLAGTLFSLAPAWYATHQNPAVALQQTARTFAGSRRTGRLLLVGQVALSLALVTEAGSLVRTLQQVRAQQVGFHSQFVSTAGLFPFPEGYASFDADRYYPQLVNRIVGVPSVGDVALSKVRPGVTDKEIVTPIASDAAGARAGLGRVGPQFFHVLDIPVLMGREFTWSDNSRAPRVAIVSRSLATRLLGGQAVGGHLRIGADPARSDVEVVGVVGDTRLFDPHDPTTDAIFVPMLQDAAAAQWPDVLIRAPGRSPDPRELRRAVESLGRESILTYRPLQRLVDRAILQERVTAMLGGFFGGLALLLAAVGVYGLTAQGVAARQREIGIRMALGASRGDVLRMIVRDSLVLIIAGLVVGAPLALTGGRLVRGMLFGIAPGDPATLAFIATLLISIGVIAATVPAHRASASNPRDTLRV